MEHPFFHKKPLLLDGGMGAELIARGLPSGVPASLYNLSDPEIVRQVHGEFIAAGSEAILTNTFQAAKPALEAVGIVSKDTEIIKRGVELARRAAGDRFVIGDIGPIGINNRVTLAISSDAIYELYLAQAEILVSEGVDALLAETQFDLREARLAARALSTAARGRPVLVSFVFERGTDGEYFTIMGDKPADLSVLLEDGASVLGANCNLRAEEMVELSRVLLGSFACPILIKPNAGRPLTRPDGSCYYLETPSHFAQNMRRISDCGASLLGGCCGVSPAHIAALRTHLRP
jgi:5-methyltetrahydrofolate--homocysteine methyltransferase